MPFYSPYPPASDPSQVPQMNMAPGMIQFQYPMQVYPAQMSTLPQHVGPQKRERNILSIKDPATGNVMNNASQSSDQDNAGTYRE